GIGFGIFRGELDLASRNAAAFVDDVDSGLGAFVVPNAPGGNHAGEIAMMADDDRSGRLSKKILRNCQAGCAGQRPALERGIKEAAASYISLLHGLLLFENVLFTVSIARDSGGRSRASTSARGRFHYKRQPPFPSEIRADKA